MRAQVFVRLKDDILDPQGEAVGRALIGLGFDTVSSVRQGKLIELELNETDFEQAEEKLTNMCEKLLANTVIENYRIDIEK